ncbi:DUF192 domain-containing protein [Candidatus Micrarchaeota archaeon]|nr:DUF192 domain-containing protein [Candidatus Micrarchaeota archaeon]MBU2476512.1 DUF192 domain-containing protein [Candidatus Micrarchaeota archaeon]
MLYNKTTKKKIIEKTKIADTFLKKLKGLMFTAKPDYALIFELKKEGITNASIHMLFVFFPIDVVYLDSNKRVVDIRLNLRPGTLYYSPKKPAKYFVEFLAGTIQNKISLNDELEWK